MRLKNPKLFGYKEAGRCTTLIFSVESYPHVYVEYLWVFSRYLEKFSFTKSRFSIKNVSVYLKINPGKADEMPTCYLRR